MRAIRKGVGSKQVEKGAEQLDADQPLNSGANIVALEGLRERSEMAIVRTDDGRAIAVIVPFDVTKMIQLYKLTPDEVAYQGNTEEASRLGDDISAVGISGTAPIDFVTNPSRFAAVPTSGLLRDSMRDQWERYDDWRSGPHGNDLPLPRY